METVIHNPSEGVYAATPDYIHAIEVRNADRTVYVAGTMGLNPSGVAGSSLSEQLALVWSNIATILGSAGMTVDNIVRITSYLRDASYATENQEARVAALGGRVVPTTSIVAQTLTSDWLVEIEVVAAA